jgi:hypothetical protein
MESFIRRIPRGSSPVKGSSKTSTRGACRKPQAIESFCRMPRESSPGRASALSARSSSASKSAARDAQSRHLVDAGGEGEMFPDREVIEQPRFVGQPGHDAFRRDRVEGEVVAVEPQRAAGRRDDPAEAPEGGGLAGAVGAHQTEHLPRPDAETQVPHGDEVAHTLW